MFSRKVRWQLIVFSVLTVLSMVSIAKDYVRVQDMAGIDKREVVVEFDDATGLYPGGLVTYRGVKVGKIERLDLGSGVHADVTVTLDAGFDIPASATAIAKSTSAIGENYIDLVPASGEGPYLRDGSVITASQSNDLQPTGDLLESVNAAAASVPRKSTDVLLTELSTALGGADQDVAQLLRSTNSLVAEANRNRGPIRELLDELPTFLGTAQDVAPEVRASLTDLAAFTGRLNASEQDVNELLRSTPGLASAVQALVSDVQSDVPVLLANLLSTGQVLQVYLPGVEQVLVVYPGVMAAVQSALTLHASPGSIKLGLRPNLEQPPTCYSGFLPYKDQRDFNEEEPRSEVPDDLYCKVPHDDPRATRGARNTPCFNNPGVRAASVEECLGRKIGSISDPLGRKRIAAPYDADNGRVLAPDGQYFEIGGIGSDEERKQTWQSLLVK